MLDYVPRKGREQVPKLVVDGKAIRAGDIAQYRTEEFYSAMEVWQITEAWGLANGNIGWANEPRDYIDAITILKSEDNAIQQEEMDKTKNKNKTTVKKGKEGKVQETDTALKTGEKK